MADDVCGNLTVNGTLTVNGPMRVVIGEHLFAFEQCADGHVRVYSDNPRGRWMFCGNEDMVRSKGNDPAKRRVASPAGVQSGVSFGVPLGEWDSEEIGLVTVAYDQQQPAAKGAELMVRLKQRGLAGDGAMRLVHAITQSLSDMPGFIARFISAASGLGPFADGPPPQMPPPPGSASALISQTNLAGALSAVQTIGDGQWLMAIDASHDTACEVEIPLTGQTWLDLEVRRTGTVGAPPYVYVALNDVPILSGYQPADSEVRAIPIPALTGTARVTILGAAQGGTLEIGGIRAR